MQSSIQNLPVSMMNFLDSVFETGQVFQNRTMGKRSPQAFSRDNSEGGLARYPFGGGFRTVQLLLRLVSYSSFERTDMAWHQKTELGQVGPARFAKAKPFQSV